MFVGTAKNPMAKGKWSQGQLGQDTKVWQNSRSFGVTRHESLNCKTRCNQVKFLGNNVDELEGTTEYSE